MKIVDKHQSESLRKNWKRGLSFLTHNYAGESAIENWKKTNFYSIRSSAKFFGWLEISSSRFFAKSAIFPIGRAKLHFQSEQCMFKDESIRFWSHLQKNVNCSKSPIIINKIEIRRKLDKFFQTFFNQKAK